MLLFVVLFVGLQRFLDLSFLHSAFVPKKNEMEITASLVQNMYVRAARALALTLAVVLLVLVAIRTYCRPSANPALRPRIPSPMGNNRRGNVGSAPQFLTDFVEYFFPSETNL